MRVDIDVPIQPYSAFIENNSLVILSDDNDPKSIVFTTDVDERITSGDFQHLSYYNSNKNIVYIIETFLFIYNKKILQYFKLDYYADEDRVECNLSEVLEFDEKIKIVQDETQNYSNVQLFTKKDKYIFLYDKKKLNIYPEISSYGGVTSYGKNGDVKMLDILSTIPRKDYTFFKILVKIVDFEDNIEEVENMIKTYQSWDADDSNFVFSDLDDIMKFISKRI